MTLINVDVFLQYLIFSKHIDSLKCKEVKEAIEMSKVDVFDKIRTEIDAESARSFRYSNFERAKALEWVLNVIDKYETEDDNHIEFELQEGVIGND